MDEYLSVRLIARRGESDADFKTRLSEFWSQMLRQQPDAFEKVYAEKSEFEPVGGCTSREYLIEQDAAYIIQKELEKNGIDVAPIDTNEIYSKYEAAPPEWFWIEH